MRRKGVIIVLCIRCSAWAREDGGSVRPVEQNVKGDSKEGRSITLHRQLGFAH